AAHLGVHADVLAAPLHERLAGLEVVALDRQVGGALELFAPFTQAVAVPRRLGLERRQPELLPDGARALHVFALGERDRWKILLERGVDEDGGVFAVVALAARAVALVAMRQD